MPKPSTRICIVGDAHLGARNGSNHFSEYFNRFFENELFPYIKKHNIKHIIQLGDLFDNRTSLSYKAFHKCRDVWFGGLKKHDVMMHVLLGNHDIHYRDTLLINSPDLLLSDNPNINIINTPTVLDIDGFKFDIIPWVCAENRKQISEFINREDRSSVLCGHLELSGFPMYKGVDSHGGTPASDFDNYSMVLSGHYHTHSQKGNIIYTGIPYEITWSDYGDPKGFFVYDTATNKLEHIINPDTMFSKIYYDGTNKLDVSAVKGKIVKIIVQDKKDPVAFERFIDSVKLASPHDMSIIENVIGDSDAELDDSIDIDDTRGIIDAYIDGLETDVDSESLKTYITSLLNEAQTMDDYK